jgi:hypothetical protein
MIPTARKSSVSRTTRPSPRRVSLTSATP